MPIDPYASGVLFKEVHAPLVANLDGFASDAGVQPFWLYTSMKDVCGPAEIEFVRKMPLARAENAKFSLAYLGGSQNSPVEMRMSAMAAALVRNFTRARVMHLGQVLEYVNAGETPDATVLLIPNFFFATEESGELRSWLRLGLLDMLYARQAAQQPTILGVSNLKMLDKQYGAQFRVFIETHYVTMPL
jgi:hypothetical protein